VDPPDSPGPVAGYVALIVDMSGRINGKARTATTVAIYQARGTLLSGVYGRAASPSQVRLVAHAARQSALDLAHS
jgi:hypothetical protein